MARDEQVRIDLVAQDKASDTIDDVADAVERLEDAKPEVVVTADTDQAERAIGDVVDEARALSRTDAELVLRARADAARAELKALQDELRQTGERAEDTARKLDRVDGDGGGGLRTRGNAISDLTGPLGEASSAASDFAGVFDGLGDIAEDAAGKFGLSAGASQVLSSAVGGLGIAVAAGAAAWTLFRQRQEDAKRKTQEMTDAQLKLNDAIQAGNREAAVTNFEQLYGKGLDAARELGVTTKDFVDYLRGVSNELPGVESRLAAYNRAAEASRDIHTGQLNPALANAAAAYENLTFVAEDARKRYDELNGSGAEQTRRQQEIAAALGVTTRELDKGTRAASNMRTEADNLSRELQRLTDRLDMSRAIEDFQATFAWAMESAKTDAVDTKDEIRRLQDEYLRVAEAIGLSPVQIESDLRKISQGEINEVWNSTQAAIDARPPVTFRGRITMDLASIRQAERAAQLGVSSTAAATAAPVTNVYMTLPRGTRPDDMMRAGDRYARRNGRPRATRR